jgi:hypothetical protein
MTELLFFSACLFVGMIIVYDFFDKEYLSGNARLYFAWIVLGLLVIIVLIRLIGAIYEIKELLKSK